MSCCPTVLCSWDYWTSQLFAHDIRSKEGLAVLFALRSLEASLYRRRINVFVDNHGLVYAWDGLKSRSSELTEVLKSIFLFCLDNRVSLKMIWVSTHKNPADDPSRSLDRSDSALADDLRAALWKRFGPFAFDLMALPSNVMRSPGGRPLPFFSRTPMPSSTGSNVFSQEASSDT